MLAWPKKWSKIAKVWDARFFSFATAMLPGRELVKLRGRRDFWRQTLVPDSVARDGTDFWSLHVMLWELMLSDADGTGKIIYKLCIYIIFDDVYVFSIQMST